jgi:hypothetical protein
MSKNTNLSFLTDYITADITNGRIGINNASPAYAFDVVGIARTSTSTYLATASGSVGIGTTSPYGQLTIQNISSNTGGVNFGEATDAASRRWQLRSDTDVFGDFGIRQSTTQTGSTYVNRLYINPSGNVGIGTNSPLTTLAINATNQIVDSYGLLSVNTTDSQAANLGGQITLGGVVSGTTQTVFGAIAGRKESSTSGEYKGYLQFSTINSSVQERMRITSDGKIGIGTTSPAQKLTVSDNTSTDLILQVRNLSNDYGTNLFLQGNNNNGASYNSVISYTFGGTRHWGIGGGGSVGTFVIDTNGSERMRITSGGRVLMGGTSDNGLGTLQVWHPTGGAGLMLRNGSDLVLEPASLPNNLAGFYNDYGSIQAFVGGATGAYCNGTTWVNGSDIRLKKDINTITFNGLDAISLLRPVSYKFISDEKEKERIGFIAQEIQEVLPQVVDDSSGEHLGVDYGSITAALVKAIQELSAEINILKNK